MCFSYEQIECLVIHSSCRDGWVGRKKKGKDGTCLYIIWGLRARAALQGTFREASQVERSALRSNWPSTNAAGTSAAVAAVVTFGYHRFISDMARQSDSVLFLISKSSPSLYDIFMLVCFLLADDGLLHIRWPPGYSQYIPSVSFLRSFDVPPPGRLYT